MIHPNDPAFATLPIEMQAGGNGMDLRSYFAAAALTGILAVGVKTRFDDLSAAAADAVYAADALIAALNGEAWGADVNAGLVKALRHIGYEPIGHAEATHREVCKGMTEIARAALAKAGVR